MKMRSIVFNDTEVLLNLSQGNEVFLKVKDKNLKLLMKNWNSSIGKEID